MTALVLLGLGLAALLALRAIKGRPMDVHGIGVKMWMASVPVLFGIQVLTALLLAQEPISTSGARSLSVAHELISLGAAVSLILFVRSEVSGQRSHPLT